MDPGSPSSEHIADSSVFRAALRRAKLAARMAMQEHVRATLCRHIERHLTSLLDALPPQILAFCVPVRGEFDCRPLVSQLINRGWQAAVPVIETPKAPLGFRTWTPSSRMDMGLHDIPFPAEGERVVPTVILLPLLAFDPQGYRLGYGGGYFDRTLAAMVPRPLAIGVGFEIGSVPSILPQEHDLPLAAVVTEAGIVRHVEPRTGVIPS